MTKVEIKQKPKKPRETQSGLQAIKKGIKKVLRSTPPGMAIKIGIDAGGKISEFLTQKDKSGKGGETTRSRISEADRKLLKEALPNVKGGGLMEATARLKAKGMKEGGMVVKEKVVAIDKSPNSGLITTKGFGAGRRT
jgi:hypothetical protein